MFVHHTYRKLKKNIGICRPYVEMWPAVVIIPGHISIVETKHCSKHSNYLVREWGCVCG